jgi:RND family efflux transporter MFP subunit
MKQLLTFLFALIMLVSCTSRKSAEATEALPVSVATPEVRTVTLTHDYPGYLKASSTVDVVARVSGTLLQSCYEGGQRVRAGQTLFRIEPTLYEDAVRQAEASLKTAEANLDYARNNFIRMGEAVKSDAVSRIEYLQAESNVATAEASVDNALAALRTARTQLDYCTVKAPCEGVVDLGTYSVGSYISGSSSPVKMATVYADHPMYAYFNVADNQFLTYQWASEQTLGTPLVPHTVTLRLDADGTPIGEGRLNYLSPNVTRATGTLQLRATLSNPDGRLRPGVLVNITLPCGQEPDAILVRDASIATDQRGEYLYVVDADDRVQYRPISVGQMVDDTLRIVTAGLLPGERYVSKALMKVREGMKILPVDDSSIYKNE